MHCAHCGRLLLRDPAATVTTRDGALHWGPKCAAKAGLTKPPRRQVMTVMAGLAAKRRRKRLDAVQADWIDDINRPETATETNEGTTTT